MTTNDSAGSASPAPTPAQPGQPEVGAPPAAAETGPVAGDDSAAVPVEPAEDPGYLVETGEAVGEDGTVVPIIGGLPAAEGSAWDIGAPADERGGATAGQPGAAAGQDGGSGAG